jgi:prepilin-type processing-associated H-X9-DG protein
MLVVVAIIVLLAALLLPFMTSAKNAAQEAKSLNNLRQIGVGLTAFIGENNGYIMPRAYAAGGAPAGQDRFWTATLYNKGYLTDKRSFYDPRFAPYGPDENATSKRIETGTPETYGMRDWVKSGETIGTLTARVAKPVFVVKSPANFFIVADSYWVAWGTQGYGISPGETSDNRVRLDEKGLAGTLFLDGHVEKMPGDYFRMLGETQGEYSDGQPFATWPALPPSP